MSGLVRRTWKSRSDGALVTGWDRLARTGLTRWSAGVNQAHGRYMDETATITASAPGPGHEQREGVRDMPTVSLVTSLRHSSRAAYTDQCYYADVAVSASPALARFKPSGPDRGLGAGRRDLAARAAHAAQSAWPDDPHDLRKSGKRLAELAVVGISPARANPAASSPPCSPGPADQHGPGPVRLGGRRPWPRRSPPRRHEPSYTPRRRRRLARPGTVFSWRPPVARCAPGPRRHHPRLRSGAPGWPPAPGSRVPRGTLAERR